MALHIGPISDLDVELDDPDAFNIAGDEVTLTGEITDGLTLDEAMALRHQLLGLIGTEQDVVWDTDPHAAGFYLVESASVTTREMSYVDAGDAAGFDFQATLIRLPGQTPGCSWRLWQDERTGTPASATPKPWHAVPSTRKAYDVGEDASVSYYTRTGPRGSVHYWESTTVLNEARPYGQIDPGDWWDMAPLIKVGGHIVTGENAPVLEHVATQDWSIDNGIIGFRNTATSNALFEAFFPDVDGDGEWNDAHAIQIGYYDGTTWRPQTNLVGLKFFRTDPEEALLALFLRIAHPINPVVWDGEVTIRLRRGGLYAGPDTHFYSNLQVYQTGLRYNLNQDWTVSSIYSFSKQQPKVQIK